MTRDAVVAGGGLAGALAALVLARRGAAVAMVEASPPDAQPRDGRSLALSLATVRVLQSLGLWPALASSARAIETVHVSEAGRFGLLRFTARDLGVAALGQVVPATELLGVIESAAAEAGVERLRPAVVEAAPLAGGLRAVETGGAAGGSVLPARLLVVADGAGSALREALGIAGRVRRFESVAVVTTALAAHPRPGFAFERFTPDGILALLPRRGDDVGVVWTLEPARAEAFAALPPEEFLARVEAAIGGRLGRLSPRAPLMQFPLSETHAARQTAERAVVIGNAAHALHPVAAQGFNLTVRDIAVLAESAAREPGDFGSASVLARYARARRRDQARTRAFTGWIRSLGDLRIPAASPVRGAGLCAAELLHPFARRLARQGMGLGSRPLPALVRGAPL